MRKKIVSTIIEGTLGEADISLKNPVEGFRELLPAGISLADYDDIVLSIEDDTYILTGYRMETNEEMGRRSEQEIKELKRLVGEYPVAASLAIKAALLNQTDKGQIKSAL